MPNQVYKIARVTDAQISQALVKLGQEFGEFDANINVMQVGLGSVRFPENQKPAAWQQVVKLGGELVDHFGANINGVSFTYYRGGQTGVGADANLSHRADPILSQGWKPTLRGSAVDKFRV